MALDRLAALGTRGRAIDADRATIRAGLAALAGDRGAALAGYRTAMSAYRDLGLAWDEALLGHEAATTLGTGDVEVAAWVDQARATFARLGAAPMLERLEEAVTGMASVSSADPARGPVTPMADAGRRRPPRSH